MAGSEFDLIVIGAGVIGLAVARAAALAGHSVLIVDRARHFGTETSSRNSEVIHAGIYYPQGSLKARLCVEGREALYRFCESRGVPHRNCGKLIVATDHGQANALDGLRHSAMACGVGDLEFLDEEQAHALEPDITCVAALLSPSTGIIDTHAYMQALLGEAEAHGAMLVCGTDVTRIVKAANGWTIMIEGEAAPVASARMLVNAAGLGANAMARQIEGMPAEHVPELRFAKGCYFSYGGRTRFRRLIYPMPEPGGLGTHLTLDLAGRVRFGPDVEWVDTIDYAVEPTRRERFFDAIRRFWPDVDKEQLHADYAGVRPKLSGPGDPAADFTISGTAQHGVPGIVNLFGIESPGITASLAIADQVMRELEAAA